MELESAVANILLLSRGVIRRGLVERTWVVRGRVVWSSATIVVDGMKAREITDGKLWWLLLRFVTRPVEIEHVYEPASIHVE